MPITEITLQPEQNSLYAAYQPIIFRVKATVPNSTIDNYTPPIVYCDVYLNDIYYKTFTRTIHINNDGVAPEYEFDIQDALQEVMQYNLPSMDGEDVEVKFDSIKKVYTKFRNAYLDNNGFITSEQKEPIQSYGGNNSIAGEGLQSNPFHVINAVIQHEENQNLLELLDSYKTGDWSKDVYPLTKRPETVYLRICDSSYFPLLSSVYLTLLCLSIKYKNGTSDYMCVTLDTGDELKVDAGGDIDLELDYIVYDSLRLRKISIENIAGVYYVTFIDFTYPSKGKDANVIVNTTVSYFKEDISNPVIQFTQSDLYPPVVIYTNIECEINGNLDESNTMAFSTVPNVGEKREYTSNVPDVQIQKKIPLNGFITGNYTSFYWEIVSKPINSNASIENIQSLNTSLIPDLFGIYTVRLNALNNKNVLFKNEITITINKTNSIKKYSSFSVPLLDNRTVLYIPDGLPNLKKLFPNIEFNNINSWEVTVKDEKNAIIATSRQNTVTNCEQIRVHFINSVGELDSINFSKTVITQETKSNIWAKSLQYPLDRTQGGIYRKNINSNETYEAETKMYNEQEMYWLKELANTPVAWLEMILPNGFYSSKEKEYIPIVITDFNLIELKNNDRFEYITKIKFSMSNTNINFR